MRAHQFLPILIAAFLFNVGISLAGEAEAPSSSPSPNYETWMYNLNPAPGEAIATVLSTSGDAVRLWFDQHPGCPEGQLALKFTVSVEGKASDVTVASTSTIPELDRAFASDVLEYTFTPATKDGVPVPSTKVLGLTVPKRFMCSGGQRLGAHVR